MNVQTRRKTANKIDRVFMTFEDNRLLGPLYGQHDIHLAQIEQALGVTLISRGNRLAIEGPAQACERAQSVLLSLYRKLENGHAIDQGEIYGAIRMADGSSAQDGRQEKAGRHGTEAGVNEPQGRRSGPVSKIGTKSKTITPRSPAQAAYIEALKTHEMVFSIGPAGTGKTYLAVAMAVNMLLSGEVDRIVLSRPAVEAGENLGFLPGDLKEKVDPYLRPLYDALNDMLPPEQVERRILSGQIEVAPLAYMRGRTLSNAYVILDEAQNTTAMQMKMFLTRFGENSRMVIAGDPSQVDLPHGEQSGLANAIGLLDGVDGIAMSHFSGKDVVRHPLVGRIVDAYDNDGHQQGQQRTG